MASLKNKKYIVTVRQKVLLPHRRKPDDIDRDFTIYAKTSRSAKTSIRNAGIKGKIIKVKLGGKG